MTDSLLERLVAGRTDLVWEWVARGHEPSTRTRDGLRLIEWCAYYGDVSAVRFLLDRGESLASLGDNLGLNAAAFHGHWRLVEFLLEQGADVNGTHDGTGETALHAAICTRRRDAHDLVLRVLLGRHADVHRTTIAGVETGAFMRDARTRGETALHRAAAFGSERTIELLLSAGASREVRDANGDTPLAWASWYARPDAIIRQLCFGEHRVHPDRVPMQRALLGEPVVRRSVP